MVVANQPVARPLRFGVFVMAARPRRELAETFRRAERLGYDVIGVADHLGLVAPIPSLLLAGGVTERPRLATTVLNAAFYRPALLARDLAAVDDVTGGRLEVGLGAGYVPADLDVVEPRLRSAPERLTHLERMVVELRRRFADPAIQPRPVQQPHPPLCIAGNGRRLLTLAAAHADIVGFSGTTPGGSGLPDLVDRATLAGRVGFARGLLGARDVEVELNVHVWSVAVTDDRRAEARRLAASRNLSAEQLLELPTALIGSPKHIAEQLLDQRDEFGFSYVTVGEQDLDAMAAVIEVLR